MSHAPFGWNRTIDRSVDQSVDDKLYHMGHTTVRISEAARDTLRPPGPSWGAVSTTTMATVEDHVRMLLRL
jgi:hypothetical protein